MKLFSKVTLLASALIFSGVVFGQKSQNEQFSSLSSTTFKVMGGSTYEFRSETDEVGNLRIYMTETYKSGNKSDEKMFVADHGAFPTSFVSANMRSDNSPLEDLKVVGKKTSSTSDRLIFVDNKMYQVWYWKDKDSYKLKRVVAAQEISDNGKKKGGGLKAMKAAMAESKKTDEEKKAPLQAYLNEATKKQEELIPTWEAENKEYLEKVATNEKRWEEYVQKVNSDYWNSPEGQATLKKWREDEGKASNFTIKNETGNRLYVINEMGTVSWVAAGGTSDFFCSKDIYYCHPDADGNHTGEGKGALIASGENACGTTVTVK